MEVRAEASRSPGRGAARRRFLANGGAAIAATIVTSLLVALLASRPESPLTPELFPGSEAPGLLAAGARFLGLDSLSREVAAALSAAFLVAAAAAFVYALRQAWNGRLSLARVMLVAVLLHGLALAVPLFLSRDVYSYGIYGRIVSEYGANPYTQIPVAFASDPLYPLVSVDWIDSPSVYGPGFVVIAAGVTSLVSSPAGTVFAFKLLAAVASLATVALVATAARRARPERAAFAAVMVGWNPVVLFHGVAGGHNDTLVGLALAAAIVLLFARREVLATAVLALGTLVKVSAGVPLALAIAAAVVRRPKGERMRALAVHAGVALAVALPFVVPFMQAEDPTLGALELSTRQGWLAPSRFVHVLAQGAARFLGGDVAAGVASVVVRIAFPALFVIVLVALVRYLARAPERIDPPVALGAMAWGTLVAVTVSPLLYPWYVAWLLPLAWVLPRKGRAGMIVITVALAVTELLAEPSRAPRVWEAMVFGLHYVATPVVLGVMVWLLLDLRRRLAVAPDQGWDDPLLAEAVVTSGSAPAEDPRRDVSADADARARDEP